MNINMNNVIETICDVRDRAVYDTDTLSYIMDLWEATRSYLARFIIVSLEKTSENEIVGLPWHDYVEHRLKYACIQYGYRTISATIHGIDYSVNINEPEGYADEEEEEADEDEDEEMEEEIVDWRNEGF